MNARRFDRSKRFDCLCLGIVVADHVCHPIDHVPKSGELVLTERTTLSIGGCAANVAVDLAKLGRTAGVVGCIGDDYFGRYITESLGATGVDCSQIVAIPGEATSCSMIVNVRGDDRRFIHARGANARFTAAEIARDRLRETSVLYLGGYCLSEQPTPANVAALFEAARREGCQTVLDVVIPGPGDYWRFLRPVLPHTDVFMPNADEASAITGLSDEIKQAETFREAGAATAVITCGGEGTVLVDAQQRLRAKRFPVDVVDGTGSGDAFAAGYIDGLLRHADAKECLRRGAALGASCVRATGATTGVFTSAELEAFLESHEFSIERI